MRGVYLKILIPILVLLGLLGGAIPQVQAQETILVPLKSTWKRDTTGTDLGTAWKDIVYDDSTWASGPAPIGFPVGESLTVAGQNFGPIATVFGAASPLTYYFRTTFNNLIVADPSTLTLVLTNILDDGAIYYLNGEEIFRTNMPVGAVTFTTQASASVEANGRVIRFARDASDLLPGLNTLAVEVHQNGTASSDLVHEMSLSAVVAFGPTFTQQPTPASTNVLQGRNATITAVVTGSPTPTLQWMTNGVAIPGATGPSYTITDMTSGQAGSYILRATGNSGVVDSSPAVVTYTADQQPPTVVSAIWTNDTTIVLTFDERVVSPANDPFTYAINGNFVANAVFANGGADDSVVIISAGFTRDPNQNYDLVIADENLGSGAPIDRFGNAMSLTTVRIAGFSTLIDYSSVWRFYQLGSLDASPTWKDTGFDDSTWATGPGVHGQETVGPSVPLIMTDLMSPSEGGPNTVYFRAHFSIAPPLSNLLRLNLTTLLDDAVVIYFNGTEVFRSTTPDLPAGVPTFATQPNGTVGDAAFEGPFNIPTNSVLAGDNVIAVELHQGGTASSDAVWGCKLEALLASIITGPPDFTVHPANASVNEGSPASFSATAVGTQPISYQWTSNGVDIAGATGSTLSFSSASCLQNGVAYRVRASNTAGTTTSNPGVLTVTCDTTKPLAILAIGEDSKVTITFSEPLAQASAETTGNYEVGLRAGGGLIAVSSAVLTNNTNVVLNLASPLVAGSNYKVTINNVTDRASIPNAILANTMIDVCARVIVVATNGVWKYDQRGVDLGAAWHATVYDDSAWSFGPAPLGVEGTKPNYAIATPLLLNYVNQANETNPLQTITYYFRAGFSLDGNPASAVINLRPLFDDAIAIYLNGGEVWRQGLTNVVIPYGELGAGHEADNYEGPINIGNTNLVGGQNVLAVEVHQTTTNSTDIVFGLIVEALIKDQVPPIRLNIRLLTDSSGMVEITWNAPGYTLVQSDTATGGYSPAPDQDGNYTFQPTATTAKFFQLRSP